MKKKILATLLSVSMTAVLLAGCGSKAAEAPAAAEPAAEEAPAAEPAAEEAPAAEDAAAADFAGEELSILVSAGWMDNRYDVTLARFEETYGVTVDLQTIPADQYSDILKSKLDTGTCADVFWIQSNPFAIDSVIVDPENYCIDFTGAAWQNLVPEARQASCMSGDKLYGLQIWHNSPEYVMVYNKSLFDELGLAIPKTYTEMKDVCAAIAAEGVTPWFIPGADGWQHPLAFFQIGGVYEEAQPGLYDALNTNQATFADNEKMLEVLGQYKELSDLGYFGEDWIGTDSTNMTNEFGDRNCAMATMFGYKGSEHPELVSAFFDFVCTTESLQEILDNSPAYTNLDMNDAALEQHWLPEEEEFMNSVDKSKMLTAVLQTGTKYTNDYWMDFGADLVAFCQNQIQANDVLKNMDTNRAEAAKVAGDTAW